VEATTASVSYNFKDRPNGFNKWGWLPFHWRIIEPLFLASPQYFGFSTKLSYIKKITPFLFIQPNIVLKFPFYLEESWTRNSFTNTFTEDNKTLEKLYVL